MSGLEKILEQINKEATDTANETINSANSEAEKILKKAEEDAEAKRTEIAAQSKLDVASTAKQIQSVAAQMEKKKILVAKQGIIDGILDSTLDYLENLDTAEYFAIIDKMIEKYAGTDAGIIQFNEKDLARIPEGTINLAKQKNLTLSKDTVDISGGFILGYGNIDENCSFDGLLLAKRESLQDKIGQILFS
ncbi:MAG: V-type ATP synthase subunit E [Lachnospiraceae bacterium]|nr:V-type ATP synthase subunit E [Lachnospiraceae bacterium]